MPSFQELLIVAIVGFVLFGARRIPEFLGSLGKGITEFKKGISDETT